MNNDIVIDEVAPSEYGRIINAAISMTRSKFGLAEALALDIPSVAKGHEDGSVSAALKEVAKQIVDAGGDEVAWRTLRNYRLTALWSQASTDIRSPFRWRTGSSYSAHERAASGGMDYDLFAKQQRTELEVRAMLGRKVDDSVKQTVGDMTDTDKADLIAALVKDNTEGVAAVVQTQRIADLPINVSSGRDDGSGANAPTVGTVSTSLDNYDIIVALKEVIGGTRQWMSTQITKWERAMYAVKGVMTEEDRNVIAGYYLDIAGQWTDRANKLKDNEWTQ